MRVVNPEAKTTDLTGCVMPWSDNRPLFVRIEGRYFIPIFSSPGKLHAQMQQMQVQDYVIKQITDGNDFLAGLTEQGVPVALDPHRENGKVRFHLCVPP